jgi:hypothetical protein
MMLLKLKAPGSSLTRERPPHYPLLYGRERVRSAKIAARERVTRPTSHRPNKEPAPQCRIQVVSTFWMLKA